MDFEKKMPEWENEGTEPSAELKTNGFQGGYKPPAGIFNWFWSLITNAIKEIQENLSNVENTKDSEKSVNTANFASEAGVGRKVKYPFIFRLNGGDTENTDLWNYDGSVSKSVNLTPEKLGARPTEKPNIVVNAVREVTDDGKEIYKVTDSNITDLYDGLEITIIPNERNTTSSPRLQINDFGDNGIRLALSFNCAATTTFEANYFQIDRPITLKYHANLNLGIQGQGAWLFADRIKTSAQDLYGDVPIESGGTGASSAKDGLNNLLAGKNGVVLHSEAIDYGTLSSPVTINNLADYTLVLVKAGTMRCLCNVEKSENSLVIEGMGTNLSNNKDTITVFSVVLRGSYSGSNATINENKSSIVPFTSGFDIAPSAFSITEIIGIV